MDPEAHSKLYEFLNNQQVMQIVFIDKFKGYTIQYTFFQFTNDINIKNNMYVHTTYNGFMNKSLAQRH